MRTWNAEPTGNRHWKIPRTAINIKLYRLIPSTLIDSVRKTQSADVAETRRSIAPFSRAQGVCLELDHLDFQLMGFIRVHVLAGSLERRAYCDAW